MVWVNGCGSSCPGFPGCLVSLGAKFEGIPAGVDKRLRSSSTISPCKVLLSMTSNCPVAGKRTYFGISLYNSGHIHPLEVYFGRYGKNPQGNTQPALAGDLCSSQTLQLPAVVRRAGRFAGRHLDAEYRPGILDLSNYRFPLLSGVGGICGWRPVPVIYPLRRGDCRPPASAQCCWLLPRLP
jgi:hypothetical protein